MSANVTPSMKWRALRRALLRGQSLESVGAIAQGLLTQQDLYKRMNAERMGRFGRNAPVEVVEPSRPSTCSSPYQVLDVDHPEIELPFEPAYCTGTRWEGDVGITKEVPCECTK